MAKNTTLVKLSLSPTALVAEGTPTAETRLTDLRVRHYYYGSYRSLGKVSLSSLAKVGIFTLGDLTSFTKEEVKDIKRVYGDTLAALNLALSGAGLKYSPTSGSVSVTVKGELAARTVESAKMAGQSPAALLSSIISANESLLLESVGDVLAEQKRQKAAALFDEARKLQQQAHDLLAEVQAG